MSDLKFLTLGQCFVPRWQIFVFNDTTGIYGFLRPSKRNRLGDTQKIVGARSLLRTLSRWGRTKGEGSVTSTVSRLGPSYGTLFNIGLLHANLTLMRVFSLSLLPPTTPGFLLLTLLTSHSTLYWSTTSQGTLYSNFVFCSFGLVSFWGVEDGDQFAITSSMVMRGTGQSKRYQETLFFFSYCLKKRLLIPYLPQEGI